MGKLDPFIHRLLSSLKGMTIWLIEMFRQYVLPTIELLVKEDWNTWKRPGYAARRSSSLLFSSLRWLVETFKQHILPTIKLMVKTEQNTWKRADAQARKVLALSRLTSLVTIMVAIPALHTSRDYGCHLPSVVVDVQIYATWDGVYEWCHLITRNAVQNRFEPSLIAAIVWVESRGDPLAHSRSGAVGLMQVMPRDGLSSTFMCRDGPCFADRPNIRQLENAAFNVHYGTELLAYYLAEYGNLRDALKAYGPRDYGYAYADLVLSVAYRISNSG